MPWFKVDDGLHAHRKVIRATRRDVAPMGLWVLAGAWSSDQLSDGWIPEDVAARLDRDYEDHAAALVAAGLWIEEDRAGERGWQFHDWSVEQPSAESVKEKRAAARERMRELRGKRRGGSQDVRANTAGTSHEVRSAPTRPDPITQEPKTSSSVTPSAPRDADRPDVDAICNHLADRIEENGSKRPTITAKWRTEARLLLDKDGRTVEQVKTAIDWCQGDEFWRANVLSMPSLRKQYDRLRLAAKRGNVHPLRAANGHQAYRDPTDMSVYSEGL